MDKLYSSMIKQREDFLTLLSSWKQAANLLVTKATSSLVILFILGSFVEFFLLRFMHGFEALDSISLATLFSYTTYFVGYMIMDTLLLLFIVQVFSTSNKSFSQYCSDNSSTIIVNFCKILIINTVKCSAIITIAYALHPVSMLLSIIAFTTMFALLSLVEFLAIFEKLSFLENFRQSIDITSNFLAPLVIFLMIFYCYPAVAIKVSKIPISIPILLPLLKAHCLLIHRKHRLSRTALQETEEKSTKTKSE